MEIANNYRWEGERSDGTIIIEGDNLVGCERFSLIPQVAGLPRHDIIGVHLVRRFNRGFVRIGNKKPPEYLYCVVGLNFRMYVRASDGAVILTPQDYELYL